MASERCCLAADAFHHVAVTAQRIHLVVEQRMSVAVVRGGEPTLRDGHAHAGRRTLTERAGGGLDARSPAVFRVPSAAAASLPKAFQIGQRHGRSTQLGARLLVRRTLLRLHCAQVQQAVEQRRRVADRQHEAVTVRPLGIVRVVAQEALPQAVRGWRRTHRCAGVAGVRLLHRVNGQGAQCVDAQLIEACRVVHFVVHGVAPATGSVASAAERRPRSKMSIHSRRRAAICAAAASRVSVPAR